MVLKAEELRDRVLVYEKVRQPDDNGQMIEVSRKLKCEFLSKVTQSGMREASSGEIWDNSERWVIETWFWPSVVKDDVLYIPEYDVWVDIDTILYSKPFMRLEGNSRESV